MKTLALAAFALISALATPALACSQAQRTLIMQYYWTTVPLCTTQPMVSCSIEALRDPSSPCRISACRTYTLTCSPTYAQAPWMTLRTPG